MIIDCLKNYKFYDFLSKDVFIGLEFLAKLDKEVDLGEYMINDNVKAIITEYRTKEVFEKGYEAHRRVIDIQYPLIGRERILWDYRDNLNLRVPYDVEKDVEYYDHNCINANQVDIGNSYFAIMFPDDAHSPQRYIDEPELIKKATIKVKF
ncbi:YhcH/YjgK/YiaL family protein [Joostella sp. CR20]|uniref:YhcH/YjgK/YiaL family protein n=1 Tax=Joostella sp. CR20 TaxID=2804312 RepID=UPI00313B8DBE